MGIQKNDVKTMGPAYLMDEGSTISLTPNAEKLSSEVGVKLASYQDTWFDQSVSVLEMDGAVDARGAHLPRVAAVRHRHQVLRRDDRADRQEPGLARLGQRHRPHADALLLQDPRGVREAHRVKRARRRVPRPSPPGRGGTRARGHGVIKNALFNH